MRLPSLWRGDSLLQRWLGDDFERFFDEFFARRGLPIMKTETAIGFMPEVDVIEHEDDYVIKAELPGIAGENIDVSMVGEALQIKGEKKEEKEEKKESYYSCERTYGSFLRTIPLPIAVDADKITAKLEKGVLEVTCPKSALVKPRKIDVKGEMKEEPVAMKGAEAPRPRDERAREKR